MCEIISFSERIQCFSSNIVAAFQGMHVSPAKHSYAWLPRKCDYRTDSRTDRQTDGQTDRGWTKWSLCAAMLRRRHKNPAIVFRSRQNPLWHQRRRYHGNHTSFHATLWTSASHCNCPIYFVWWTFLVCKRTSFGKRWGSINDKLLLTVSHIFPRQNPPWTKKSAKTQLQRDPFWRIGVFNVPHPNLTDVLTLYSICYSFHGNYHQLWMGSKCNVILTMRPYCLLWFCFDLSPELKSLSEQLLLLCRFLSVLVLWDFSPSDELLLFLRLFLSTLVPDWSLSESELESCLCLLSEDDLFPCRESLSFFLYLDSSISFRCWCLFSCKLLSESEEVSCLRIVCLFLFELLSESDEESCLRFL